MSHTTKPAPTAGPAPTTGHTPTARKTHSRFERRVETPPATARGRARTHPKPPTSRLGEVKARRQAYNETNRFFTINGASLRFSPELAGEVGLLESLILLQYEFWSATEGIPVGDHIAVHDSVRALRLAFPFCGGTTVDSAFNSLVRQKLLRWETAPGGRNDGRYVFICFEKARTLHSIVVANRPLAAPAPREENEPEGVSRIETPVSKDETPLSDDEVSNNQVSRIGTPPQVSNTWTPESRIWTPESEIGTPPSSSWTPPSAAYKERVRAIENKESKESVGEERAQESTQNFGSFNPGTEPDPTHTPLKDSLNEMLLTQQPLTQAQLESLFFESDVQILLASFGFNTTRPDSLQKLDWEVLPGAVQFMRTEKITPEELCMFSKLTNMRWQHPPYLSQLETHFYKVFPSRARAKARAMGAANNPHNPAPAPVQIPVTGTPTTDDLLDAKQEERRRALRACATVFATLPENEQAQRAEEAVNALSALEKDRYQREINLGQEHSPGIVYSWREKLLKNVWIDHKLLVKRAIAALAPDASTEIDADELGPIPTLAHGSPAESETLASTEPIPDAVRPQNFQRGTEMAGAGDIGGALMNTWRARQEQGQNHGAAPRTDA